MLNRRNLRIKVMQALYATTQNSAMDKSVVGFLSNSISKVYSMVIINLLFLTKVAAFAASHAKIKATKHLSTEEDKNASIKLSENCISLMLDNDTAFTKFVAKEKLEAYVKDDMIKELFKEVSNSESYQEYLGAKSSPEEDKKILTFIYKKIFKGNEAYQHHLEDIFPTWPDDKNSVTYEVLNIIKRIATLDSKKELAGLFHEFLNETIVEEQKFGSDLLSASVKHSSETLDMIEATLKNWMMDRVSLLDMILLRMALCEFLYFSKIPVKVTMNEYIEISKIYSTDKSKEFINGILDKIMKDLKKIDKIKKTGRGLAE